MPDTAMHWRMTRSVSHTLKDLADKNSWFPFLALSFFSMAVPIAKLVGTFFLVKELRSKRALDVLQKHKTIIYVLGYLASYQFVDLYCGILFVCYFNSDAADARFEG